jgi:hypothetical protein
VRDRLREFVPLTAAQCEISDHPEGMPPPACGELFVAVHAGAWGPYPGGTSEGIDETIGVRVTVTVRTGKTAKDRLGQNVWAGPAGSSLDETCRKVLVAVHLDAFLLATFYRENANATINTDFPGIPRSGFATALEFEDGGTPTRRGPYWFSAEGNDDPPAGLSQTMTFGRARRVQNLQGQQS